MKSDDKERPLNERGRSDAPRMGSHAPQALSARAVLVLERRNAPRDLGAHWARTTMQSLKRISSMRFTIASGHTILEPVRACRATFRRCSMIGHNPGLEDCAHDVREPANNDERAHAAALHRKISDRALAVLDFDCRSTGTNSGRAGRLSISSRRRTLRSK